LHGVIGVIVVRVVEFMSSGDELNIGDGVVLVVVDIFSVRELMGVGVVNVITTGDIVLVVGILKTGGDDGVVGMGQ